MPHTHCDGGCPLCDWLTSVTGHYHCGGEGGEQVLWAPSATSFLLMASGPAVFLEAFPLPLLDSARMSGTHGVNSRIMAPPHHQQWLSAPPIMWKASQPRLPGSATMQGEGGKAWCLFLRDCYFCPSYTPGHSVKAAAQHLTVTVLTGAAEGAELCLQSPTFPLVPPLLLIPIHPPSDVRSPGSFSHVCMLSRDPLLSYSCPT